jgi:chromosome segregation ATPase
LKNAEGLLHAKDKTINELQRNIRVTKLEECESLLKITENECARLRRMVNELVASKCAGNPTEYIAIEEKLLEHTIALKELRKQNTELTSALNRKNRENELLSAQLNDLEEELSKGLRKSGGANKQRRTIAGYKERIMELVNEVNNLRKQLERQVEVNEGYANDNRASMEIEQARVTVGEYKKKMEEAMSNEEAYKEKLQDMSKGMEEYKRRLENNNKKLEEYKRQINDNVVDITNYKAELSKLKNELKDKNEVIKEAEEKLERKEEGYKNEELRLKAKVDASNVF